MNAWVSFVSGGLGPRNSTINGAQQANGSAAPTFRTPYGEFALKAAKAAPTKADGDTSATRTPDVDLDRDAFLQLLVLQMQHQDPLEPVDNGDMLAQLAQFSSLEQMNQLNDSFETLSGNIDQLNFISASSLLGRHVTGVDMAGESRSGTVESVHLDGSIVYLTVDGSLMSMAGIMGIDTNHDESSATSTGS
jgi:flagellar basal-body rod modification protein FlgD